MSVIRTATGLLLLAFGVLSSQAIRAAEAAAPVTAELSPQTRALFIREMQALDGAMGRIHSAIVKGEHAAVAAEARTVHDSFVLAGELTGEQRAEITQLPEPFLEMDGSFHLLSERLQRAGEQRDSELQRLWFDEMTRACLRCHQRFAGQRFPGLSDAEQPTPDDHSARH